MLPIAFLRQANTTFLISIWVFVFFIWFFFSLSASFGWCAMYWYCWEIEKMKQNKKKGCHFNGDAQNKHSQPQNAIVLNFVQKWKEVRHLLDPGLVCFFAVFAILLRKLDYFHSLTLWFFSKKPKYFCLCLKRAPFFSCIWSHALNLKSSSRAQHTKSNTTDNF